MLLINEDTMNNNHYSNSSLQRVQSLNLNSPPGGTFDNLSLESDYLSPLPGTSFPAHNIPGLSPESINSFLIPLPSMEDENLQTTYIQNHRDFAEGISQRYHPYKRPSMPSLNFFDETIALYGFNPGLPDQSPRLFQRSSSLESVSLLSLPDTALAQVPQQQQLSKMEEDELPPLQVPDSSATTYSPLQSPINSPNSSTPNSPLAYPTHLDYTSSRPEPTLLMIEPSFESLDVARRSQQPQATSRTPRPSHSKSRQSSKKKNKDKDQSLSQVARQAKGLSGVSKGKKTPARKRTRSTAVLSREFTLPEWLSPDPVLDDVVSIGEYSRAERRAKLLHFKEKKRRGIEVGFVRYRCRRNFANNRQRVGGRFVKLDANE